MRKELKIYLPDKLHYELKKHIESENLSYSEYVRNLIKEDLKKKQNTNVVSLFDKNVYWVFSG